MSIFSELKKFGKKVERETKRVFSDIAEDTLRPFGQLADKVFSMIAPPVQIDSPTVLGSAAADTVGTSKMVARDHKMRARLGRLFAGRQRTILTGALGEPNETKQSVLGTG